MASVCVDNDDFDVIDGRLELKPHFIQSNAVNFTHVLDGAIDAEEQIGELPALIIPVAGTWVVHFEAHGNATITASAPGIGVSASASAFLYRNGLPIPATETRVVTNIRGAAVTQEPALQIHGTGGASRVVTLAAGDALTVWGSRNSDPGTTTQILSSATGRTRITAFRIGG